MAKKTKPGLDFQERADGFRVVRYAPDGTELMLASVCCRRVLGPGEEYDAALDAHVKKANKGKDEGDRLTPEAARRAGPALYAPLPRAECTVHAAGGPLAVADLEAILAGLPNE